MEANNADQTNMSILNIFGTSSQTKTPKLEQRETQPRERVQTGGIIRMNSLKEPRKTSLRRVVEIEEVPGCLEASHIDLETKNKPLAGKGKSASRNNPES